MRNTSEEIQKVEEHLREKIRSGKIKPGDRMPSLRGLVQHLKVSSYAVREAFHELKKSGQVISRPGYGHVAAGGACPSLFRIGLYLHHQSISIQLGSEVVPYFTPPLGDLGHIEMGIRQAIQEKGGELVILQGKREPRDWPEWARRLRQGDFSGIILSGVDLAEAQAAVVDSRIPALFLRCNRHHPGITLLEYNPYESGMMMMELALGFGHRRILVVMDQALADFMPVNDPLPIKEFTHFHGKQFQFVRSMIPLFRYARNSSIQPSDFQLRFMGLKDAESRLADIIKNRTSATPSIILAVSQDTKILNLLLSHHITIPREVSFIGNSWFPFSRHTLSIQEAIAAKNDYAPASSQNHYLPEEISRFTHTAIGPCAFDSGYQAIQHLHQLISHQIEPGGTIYATPRIRLGRTLAEEG